MNIGNYELIDSLWDGPVILSYTREQALEEGVLVDVSALARETSRFFARLTCPLVMTAGVWAAVGGEKRKRYAKGRKAELVLHRASSALKCAMVYGEYMATFKVRLGKQLLELWVILDDAVTILFPEEY